MTTSPVFRECAVPLSLSKPSSWWPVLPVLPSLATIGLEACNLCTLHSCRCDTTRCDDSFILQKPWVVSTWFCFAMNVIYLNENKELKLWSCHPWINAQLITCPSTSWPFKFSGFREAAERQDVSRTSTHWPRQDFQLRHLHRQGQRGQGHLCKYASMWNVMSFHKPNGVYKWTIIMMGGGLVPEWKWNIFRHYPDRCCSEGKELHEGSVNCVFPMLVPFSFQEW